MNIFSSDAQLWTGTILNLLSFSVIQILDWVCQILSTYISKFKLKLLTIMTWNTIPTLILQKTFRWIFQTQKRRYAQMSRQNAKRNSSILTYVKGLKNFVKSNQKRSQILQNERNWLLSLDKKNLWKSESACLCFLYCVWSNSLVFIFPNLH